MDTNPDFALAQDVVEGLAEGLAQDNVEGLAQDVVEQLVPPQDLAHILLECIADPSNSDPHFHANLFVDLLFCQYIPVIDVQLPFNFKTGFDALIQALNLRFPNMSAWDATKGHMGYHGTMLHHILSNIYTPQHSFAGNVKDYFGCDLIDSYQIADYCLSEEGLQELLPIIHRLSKFEPEFTDYYDETALVSLVKMGRNWFYSDMPQRLQTFREKYIAILKGNFVRPIQRAVRKWYQRRRQAADFINHHCFEYVLRPDCPIRQRFLEKSKLLAV